MSSLFFAIDDSAPTYPVFYLVVGEDNAREFYDNDYKIFDVGTTSDVVNKLASESVITILDITAGTHQWTPFE